MYAIYYSVKNWDNLIRGSKIIINTDNKNILNDTFDYIKKQKDGKLSYQNMILSILT